MLPDQWLKLPSVLKIRNKLVEWKREDFIAFAQSEFRRTELTKADVSALVTKLKDPKLQKPLTEITLGETPVETETLEFAMKPNPGKVGYAETHWYLTEGRAGLRFKDEEEATAWALGLVMADTHRNNWNQLMGEWRERTRLDRFTPESYGVAAVDPALNVVLKRLNRQNAKLKTPLPDNATIRKRYWSLQEGDTLLEGESVWRVSAMRVNLDGPPTITVKKEMDHGVRAFRADRDAQPADVPNGSHADGGEPEH